MDRGKLSAQPLKFPQSGISPARDIHSTALDPQSQAPHSACSPMYLSTALVVESQGAFPPHCYTSAAWSSISGARTQVHLTIVHRAHLGPMLFASASMSCTVLSLQLKGGSWQDVKAWGRWSAGSLSLEGAAGMNGQPAGTTDAGFGLCTVPGGGGLPGSMAAWAGRVMKGWMVSLPKPQMRKAACQVVVSPALSRGTRTIGAALPSDDKGPPSASLQEQYAQRVHS